MKIATRLVFVAVFLLGGLAQGQVRPIGASPAPLIDSLGRSVGNYYNYYPLGSVNSSVQSGQDGYTLFDVGDGRIVALPVTPMGFDNNFVVTRYYTSSDCSGTAYADVASLGSGSTYSVPSAAGSWAGLYGISWGIESGVLYVTSAEQSQTIIPRSANNLSADETCNASFYYPQQVAPLVQVADLGKLYTPPFWLVTLPSPTFSPAPATGYAVAAQVSLRSATSGGEIRYTTDGSTPTPRSAVYTGPIDVYENTTVKAIAVSTVGYTVSPVATAFYGVLTGGVEFSPTPGTYSAEQDVRLIGPASANTKVYYTTDGTTPTAASKVYTTEIPVSVTTTIKAIAVAEGYEPSLVSTAVYTIK